VSSAGDVVVFGLGHSAEVSLAFFEAIGKRRVVGFTADPEYLGGDAEGRAFHGRPVVAWPELESRFAPGEVELFAPISYVQRNGVRAARFADGRARGYRFASLVHPSARVHDAEIGENCFVHENVVVQPHARIGEDCVIWSGSCVGHHTTLGDHAFLAIQVALSGGIRVGERCFFGVSAAVRDNVSIGHSCVVGAGAVVLRSLADFEVVEGVARPESEGGTPE
jgi:sugar O-acyltransferase (sialic acid O-acetyltransferase NeuD family)